MLVLPIQSIGKSNEHILSPGTLTLSAETLLRVLVETGESVHRAGLRKMVLANSHGGNASVLATAARELRVRFGMLAVATHWRWFGLPDGMYDAVEAKHGIHAGDIETSLMLDFRRDLVRMDKAKNFVSSAVAMEKEFKHLSAGRHAFVRLDRAGPQSGRRGRQRRRSRPPRRARAPPSIRPTASSSCCAT